MCFIFVVYYAPNSPPPKMFFMGAVYNTETRLLIKLHIKMGLNVRKPDCCVHPRRLISAFIVRSLKRLLAELATYKFQYNNVTEQAG